MNRKYNEISISDLEIDVNNPRLSNATNQRDAIRIMIEDQKKKLEVLANDIIESGLSPSELPIIIPHDKEKDKYIVLEGNRRVTALKLLLHPRLTELAESSSFEKKFISLSEKFNMNPIKKIRCVIFPSREDAKHWIEIRHIGENNGIGIVKWDSIQKDRFMERNKNKKSYTLQIIDFIRAHAGLDEDIKEKINTISKTNLERLIQDPDVRKSLGLEFKDNKIYTKYPEEEVLKGLKHIITDLVKENINVNDIYYKKDRKKYMESLPPKAIPKKVSKEEEYIPLSKFRSQGTNNNNKIVKSKKSSTTRKTLIPKSFTIRIENEPRINDIYKELKRLLIDDFPNIASAMLRIFIELSIDSYIEREKLKVMPKEKLSKKIEETIKDLKSKKKLNEQKLKAINVAISSKDNLLSVNTLHSYVHNKDYKPKALELKITWDNYEYFIKKIWE